jgi:subtilase family serine protease
MRVTPDVAMDADPFTGYLYGESFTIAGNSYNDAGCTATSTTTEYCESSIGGTSLASPLMAGVIAVVDQARIAAGRPVVGFANPWLYSNKIGATLSSSGINDVTAPKSPVSVLLAYKDPEIRDVLLVTINSVPLDFYTAPFVYQVCAATICEGIDDAFNFVTPGYDDVTGLGVPYAPYLINQ